jgi:NAD dependent epimerase/dehydratase
MTRKAFVTGAGGFIGSHLTELLVRDGYEVKALAHYNGANHWFHLEEVSPEVRQSIEVLSGDVTDSWFVDQAVKGVDVVFHLAALIGIPYSYHASASYVATNVSGTLNVLQACLRHSARLVHTSTSEVYGSAQRVPIDESHPLVAQSPYSATKIAADKLVESFCRSFELSAITVRPFNTFGPRQSARAVVPTVIAQALAGDSVRLGSLSPVRDLTYAVDTAAGMAAAARSSVTGEVVNLGTGRGVTIREVVDEVATLLGKTLTVQEDPGRIRPKASEVLKLISDNRKAAELIGWVPTVSLSDGLKRTIDYIGAHRLHYKADRYNI